MPVAIDATANETNAATMDAINVIEGGWPKIQDDASDMICAKMRSGGSVDINLARTMRCGGIGAVRKSHIMRPSIEIRGIRKPDAHRGGHKRRQPESQNEKPERPDEACFSELAKVPEIVEVDKDQS
jgi:hypothetical protein